MSGFRRHIMAMLAQREYIEGYAVQIGGAYPSVVSLKINNIATIVQVNQNNGYFRWNGNITSLEDCLLNNTNVEKIKVRTRNEVSMSQFARRATEVTEIDCGNIIATNLYVAFGLNSTDINNGYRSKLISISLPIITAQTSDTNACLRRADNLTDLTASYIENTITFNLVPQLTLQSAINILSALQDVTSYGGKTLTFSASTSALIQADTTAMNLVAQAQANGWTITFN